VVKIFNSGTVSLAEIFRKSHVDIAGQGTLTIFFASMSLCAITDEAEIEALRRLRESVVDGPAHLSFGWLSEKKWVVAPLESAGHFDNALADTLAEGFTQMGCAVAFAITTEAAGKPICYAVSTTKEGLLKVSLELAPFNFALIASDRSAAILCTVHDYLLIAGPAEFVKNAVGDDITAAWDSFEEEASDSWWEGRLRKIADRYRYFSGVAGFTPTRES
jgi:hypothetical protein